MDCPTVQPVDLDLSRCHSLARELGVPADEDVSLVHIAWALVWLLSGWSDGVVGLRSLICAEARLKKTMNGKFNPSALVFNRKDADGRWARKQR